MGQRQQTLAARGLATRARRHPAIIRLAAAWLAAVSWAAQAEVLEMTPIGHVEKTDGDTSILIEERFRDALLGVDALESIWVLFWFDRNDSPEQRAILRVHPRGNPANPLRGVFATRAPVRPNLIGLTRCRVLGVEGNRIRIDDIDAYPDTPVIDIKPYRPGE